MDRINNRWSTQKDEINKLKAEQALKVLARDIKDIRYVKDWAKRAGYSQSCLNELLKSNFNVNSKQVLKEVRFHKIYSLIKKDPEVTSFSVAISCGLNDEQGLCKFLKRHYGTSFSEIRYNAMLKQLNELNSQSKTDSSIKKWLE